MLYGMVVSLFQMRVCMCVFVVLSVRALSVRYCVIWYGFVSVCFCDCGWLCVWCWLMCLCGVFELLVFCVCVCLFVLLFLCVCVWLCVFGVICCVMLYGVFVCGLFVFVCLCVQ